MRNRSRGCDTQNLARATLCVKTHNILQVSKTRFSNTAAILAHLCSEIHFVTPYLGRHALTKTQVGDGDGSLNGEAVDNNDVLCMLCPQHPAPALPSGRPDLKNALQKHPARLPSSIRTQSPPSTEHTHTHRWKPSDTDRNLRILARPRCASLVEDVPPSI